MLRHARKFDRSVFAAKMSRVLDRALSNHGQDSLLVCEHAEATEQVSL